MRKPWRHPAFLRLYARLPHPWLDGAAGWLMRRERPRWLVRALVRVWVWRGRIALHDFEPGPWPSAEAFFLRRLRPGARPIGPGLVAPVDGTVVSVDRGALVVKGQALSVEALVAGPAPAGTALVVFLSPDGYHHVHAPAAARVEAVTPIAGRTFPQNDDALAARPDVYLRNARVVVRADAWTLVLVAASLVSHIEVDVRPGDVLARGQVLGRFRFGSTVVLLLPDHAPLVVGPGDAVRVGQPIDAGTEPR